jgi:hypothetical protein
LSGEAFEPKYCLSAVAFAAHDIECCSANEARSVYAADVDGDGDVDVLSAATTGIAWYANSDGRGTFAQQRIITTAVIDPTDVYASDVDGDGDVDVLSSSYDHKIAWYENTDGQGTFGNQRVITTKARAASSVHAADVDRDGDIDVLSASSSDGKIAWYENTDGQGSFGDQRVITTQADGAKSVYAADVDGDGDIDVLSASSHASNDGKITWYENTDGQGTFGNERVITTEAGFASSVHAADVDRDGDVDVLSAISSDHKIAWYENTDGQGTFGNERVIATEAVGAKSVYAADVDGDGDVDVLSAAGYGDGAKISWYENTDGQGTFGNQRVISTEASGAYSVYAADVDGDGDIDVLSASTGDYSPGKIAWYRNSDGQGTFGNQRVITTAAPGAHSVHPADVDGDGDIDVLSASVGDDKIAWYENTNGQGTFGNQRVITTAAEFALSVYAADLDGDSDVDVLSASWDDNKIAWYENTDGQGTFGNQRVITTAADGARSVYAADVDGDGDIDVLSASWRDDRIAWYENTDGRGTFGIQRGITTSAKRAESVYAADVDGDGDIDVLSASSDDHTIAWYENTNGKGIFANQRIIITDVNAPFSVYAADVDGDGDVDVLSVGEAPMAWYENTDGKGTFGNQRVITPAVNGSSVYAADVDGDGDVDVFLGSYGLINDSKIVWFENMDGRGTFGDQRVITTAANGPRSVDVADVDGDGDLDVLSASSRDGKIAWYEQRELGDSNGDGVFNSSDLVRVFQTGKYEDGIPRNATFEEGDWNGDQEFDSADLLVALQFGVYETANPRAASSVAAAVDSLFSNDKDSRAAMLWQLDPVLEEGAL